MARFTSRAVGSAGALFGMLLVGSVVLSICVWATDPPITWDVSGAWLLGLNGVATTAMTLLLYIGLARGPVSIVAPIAASYPALVVALAVMLGARPALLQWAAIAVTMAGVLTVAACAHTFEEPGRQSRRDLSVTVGIAACAALAYAVLVSAGQAAVPLYGQLQTLWMGRLISLATILLLFAARREAPRIGRRWWPVIAIQGLLDAGGYLFLFAGSSGPGAEIAAVTGSTFGVVTTVLARFILREEIGRMQWIGIVLVFGGVAALSAYG